MSAYLTFWQIPRSPFRNEDGGPIFYKTSPTNAMVKRLVYFSEQGDLLMLVSGPRGLGKTMLSDHIASQLHTDRFEVLRCNFVEPIEEADWLWTRMSQYFNKPHKTSPTPATAHTELVLQCLDDLQEERRKLVILIDDAHLLKNKQSLQDLELLASIHNRTRKAFSVVMFADPSFEALLAQSTLAKQLTLASTLAPWDRKDTENFMAEQSQIVGLPEKVYNEDAISVIVNASEGEPGKIATICENCLMEAFVAETKLVTKDLALRAVSYVTKGFVYKEERNVSEPADMEVDDAAQKSTVSLRDLMRTRKSVS